MVLLTRGRWVIMKKLMINSLYIYQNSLIFRFINSFLIKSLYTNWGKKRELGKTFWKFVTIIYLTNTILINLAYFGKN